MRFYALIMVLSGGFNLAMWSYASWTAGLMIEVPSRQARIHCVVVAATVPLLFLGVLLVPSRAAFAWLAPITLVVLLVRRQAVRRLVAPRANEAPEP